VGGWIVCLFVSWFLTREREWMRIFLLCVVFVDHFSPQYLSLYAFSESPLLSFFPFLVVCLPCFGQMYISYAQSSAESMLLVLVRTLAFLAATSTTLLLTPGTAQSFQAVGVAEKIHICYGEYSRETVCNPSGSLDVSVLVGSGNSTGLLTPTLTLELGWNVGVVQGNYAWSTCMNAPVRDQVCVMIQRGNCRH
jgi:hypothetical protein